MAKKTVTIEQFQKIAQERGGQCLSETYTNSNTKLLWECRKGHRWKALPYNVKTGTWCPHCSSRKKFSIKHMQQLAKKHGGRCLSTEYKNTLTKLLWECSEGHQWEATPSNIRYFNRWCPTCSGSNGQRKKLTIDEMHEIAERKSGLFLSSTYEGSNIKHLWQCAQGHQWEATPGSIKTGSWCPACAGNVRYTIEDMQRIAEERGGSCLSKTYTNNMTHLLWECSEGHQWKAMPMKVLHGNWCRKCHIAKRMANHQQRKQA